MSDDAKNTMNQMSNQAREHMERGVQTATDMSRKAAEAGMAGMAEFTRMFSDMKFPAMPDMDAMLSAHRRNMETLSAANRVALEGAQTVAKRHMEIVQQTMQEMTETIRELTSPDSPQTRAAKQAELLKHSYEKAVANMRELAELIQRSNGEAIQMLNHRFAEAMDEVKVLAQKSGNKAGLTVPGHPDVVVIGGGVVGSAVAYFLARDGVRVTVLERDPTYARASSSLSASSIRQQFSCPVNIALSQFGIAFLREVGTALEADGVRPEIGLVEPGYLFLASAEGVGTLRANHAVQVAHGAEVALLDPAEVQARFGWLSTDGVAAGSLGLAGEGWFDGPALMQAFRRKARSLGAVYLHAEAVGIERCGAAVRAVLTRDGARIACGVAVNAAGPSARAVAAMAGLIVPVEARKRSVFVLACKTELPGCPLVIDPSGVWFRPEGQRFLAGWSPPETDDPEEFGLEVDHHLFTDVVWPALAARVPAFAEIRVTGAWAGHYEYNTFDHNGLLGALPEVPNLVFATGFSGHGMQQAAGVGRGISELILHGGYRSLDLSALDVRRVGEGRRVLELSVV